MGQLTAQFWVAYVSCNSNYKDTARQTFEQIDVIHRMTSMYPNELRLCTTADQVEEAVQDGKLASLIAIEGGHSMDSSLELLRAFHEMGVRYMTMTHNCNTPWADNNHQDRDGGRDADYLGGMSEWGKQVVQEMNRLGIFIDLAHV